MAQKHPHPEHEQSSHSNHESNSKLEREFELERMILFTDAVFAIAITLVAIDIKWPEIPADIKGVDLYQLFAPTATQFLVFVFSFFYIGRAWSQHLNLFRLLRTYDQHLINLNLRFLFFIVIVPFTGSGPFGHVRTGFVLPLLLYMFNLLAVAGTQFRICRYIFRKKPGLSVPGEEARKQYIYVRGKYLAMMLAAIFLIMILAALLFPGHPNYVGYVFLLIFAGSLYMNRKTRKYKPKTTTA